MAAMCIARETNRVEVVEWVGPDFAFAAEVEPPAEASLEEKCGVRVLHVFGELPGKTAVALVMECEVVDASLTCLSATVKRSRSRSG
jgi:hypothetical protein